MLILPSRFTSQPQYQTRVALQNPDTRGIIGLWNFLNPGARNLATGEGVVCGGGSFDIGAKGRRRLHTSTTDYTQLVANSQGFLPTDAITIAFRFKKTDATNRASELWAPNIAHAAQFERCNTFCPYSDGNVYWDFGGQVGGTSRVNTSSPPTFGDDLWVMTSGPRGMDIWQNGILLASQGGSAIRNQSEVLSDFRIGYGSDSADGISGDLFGFSMMAIWNRQISIPAVARVSTDEWALFQSAPRRMWVAVSTAANFTKTVSASSSLSPVRVALTGAKRQATIVTVPALLRAPNAIRAASTATVATVVKRPGTVKSATIGTVASTIKSAFAIRTATSGLTATVARTFAALRTVIATSSLSGTTIRRASKIASAGVATAVTLVRATALTKTASVGTVATVLSIRVLLRTISAALSLLASASRSIQAAKVASVGTSATVSRSAAAKRAATISTSATAVRSTAITRAASVVTTASIVSIRVFLRTVSATVAMVGAAVRSIGASRTAALGTSASLAVASVYRRTISAVTSLAASALRQANAVRSASTTMLASLATSFIGGITTIFRTVTATLGSSAALGRSTRVTRDASVGLAGTLTRGLQRTLSAVSALSASISFAPVLARILTATIGMTASVVRSSRLVRIGSSALVATASKLVSITRAAGTVLVAFLAFFGIGSGPPIVCAHWTMKTRGATVGLKTRNATWNLIGCIDD